MNGSKPWDVARGTWRWPWTSGSLYDPKRRLFAIGYDARSGVLDEAVYDLLASESRLASFIAIAKDDVAAEHWFRLGRSLTAANGATALVSWSGTMFEYLMPLLVMPARRFSLLDQTCHAAVERQIAYAGALGVPWGISESAYNMRDRHETYQYRAFGVADLALKRGLASDLVVAPYASALALGVHAHEALKNLADLEQRGTFGPYGFYDALDFTRPDPDARPGGGEDAHGASCRNEPCRARQRAEHHRRQYRGHLAAAIHGGRRRFGPHRCCSTNASHAGMCSRPAQSDVPKSWSPRRPRLASRRIQWIRRTHQNRTSRCSAATATASC